MKTLLVGIGAAGNKAVMEAVELGAVEEKDTIIINSTSKDFPKKYDGKKIVISPSDSGCGKERSIAKDYAISAIKAGKLNIDEVNQYATVIVCTSVEGGTGSGSTPIIAKFFNQVYKKNVHVIAFTGFEEDVRGLMNTVEFFQEIDDKLIVQTIKNSAFITLAGGNKYRAEELANKEMCRRIRILTGQDLIASNQNIDDTDILKLSNTSGYMTIERIDIPKPLVDIADFRKYTRRMLMESTSIVSDVPSAARLGIVLNLDPVSQDAVDYLFGDIKSHYGVSFECFHHVQWDQTQGLYIAVIASGMRMPLNEIKAVYERYKESREKVNNSVDDFFRELQGLNISNDDRKFDMIRPVERGISVSDFLSGLETK